jgi:ribulose-5-phosphate 4-epimerase/fuculose-1-phosphate aldolase
MDDSELIDDVVAANRILVHQGVFDAYGHVSARDRNRPDRFWMSRSLPPGQVTADDVIEYGLDSEPVRRGENRVFFERVIHGEVYKARPDVMAVIHDHSPSLIPFCNSGAKLRPMTGNAAFLGEGVPVFDIRTVDDDGDLNICTVPQACGMAQALGSNWLVLLRGHGSVAVGDSVRQAVRHAVIAEVNARAQLQAAVLGPVHFLTASELAYARRMKPKDPDRAWRYWKSQAMGTQQ